MKHIHWKNIIKATALATLVLVGFLTVSAIALPNGESPALVNRYFGTSGNSNANQIGVLDMLEFELAPKREQTSLSTLGTNNTFINAKKVIFRIVGTSIFDDLIAYNDTAIDNLYVGYPSLQTYSAGDPLVNIDGTIQIESLADASAEDYEKLCTDDFGRLLRCGAGSITGPGPSNGSCGISDGGSFSSAPSTGLCSVGTSSSVNDAGALAEPRYSWTCAGTNGGTTASCNASYTAGGTNGACGSADGGTTSTAPTTNLCTAGTASAVSDNTANIGALYDYTWTCAGSGGGTTANCNSNYAAAPVYAWVTGAWSKCIKGEQTRTITCTQDGTTVSNNVCNTNIPPIPESTLNC